MKKYFVWVLYADGTRAVLSHKDKTAWSKPVAIKHAREYTSIHGNKTIVEVSV